ncbi:O-antigen ligase family protein [Paucidesulfovibrio longus]|uniref:O-antigen ligase family protein n=1 Tax=Paucidesulfovibrio longus TaxID=889 RepID=UPI0003B49726|nr:O-antigen ligase family protein [Paucidesulfovibrio longus]
MMRSVVVAYLFGLLLLIGGMMYSVWGLEGFREHIALVGPLFGVLGLGTVLVNPLLMLSLVFTYFPFSWGGPSVELGIVTFNPYSLGLLFFAFVGLLRFVLRRVQLPLSFTDLLLMGVSAVYLLGTLRSADVADSGFLAYNFIFLPVLSFYIIRLLIDDQAEYRTLTRFMIVGLVVFAGMAVASWAQTGMRATPLDTPPIGTATLMVFAICLIMGSDSVPKGFRTGLALFCLLAMFLTFSRVFLVILAVAPLCHVLIRKGKSVTLYLGFFIATLLLTLALLLYAHYVQPDRTIFTPEERRTEERLTSVENWKKSIYGRVSQFSAGLNSFLQRPFLGVGLYRGEQVITQHNFHVEWLEYSGVIGYMFYMLFILSHAARMTDLARTDGPIRWQMLLILLVLNNCLFNGIMHGYMPHVIFISMGLNEARAAFLRRQAEQGLDAEPAQQGKNGTPDSAATGKGDEPAAPQDRTPGHSTPERLVIVKESGSSLYNRYFRS